MSDIALESLAISRAARLVDRWGERFIERVFRGEERSFCASRRRSAQHFAARIAAKIATRRLLGGHLSLRDIEVVRDEAGAPSLRLHARAALAAGDRRLLVSLSHDAGWAIALVVLAPRDDDR